MSSTPTTLVAKDEGTYTWGPLADDVDQVPGSSQTYYKSYVRRGFAKPTAKGKKKATSETRGEETFQKFSLGDGVLVAVLGNDVGVGILTKMWDEPLSKDDQGTEDDSEEPDNRSGADDRIKLCEVRWFYRKQDLPTTMNVLKVADVSAMKWTTGGLGFHTKSIFLLQRELLYAFTGSNRPVTSTLPIVNLINVCSIISSDRFKELYPKFHPSWNALWKIELAMDSSSDESSSSDEDRDELDLAGPNAKKSKAAMDRELKLAAKTAPPSMTLHTSTGGFNLYKRAVPLVYFCQNAFDKFAKGGQGKSWFKIDWDKLAERGMKAGDWELRDDVKEVVVNPLEDGRSLLEVEIPTKSKKPRTEARRGRIPREDGEEKLDPAESSSDESDGSQLKDIESQSSEEVSGSDDSEPTGKGRIKRKRGERTPGGKRKRKNAATTPSKRRKTTKSSRKKVKETYEAITTQLDPHLLPKDPYERALHLLHVGATPDTLPCRESEFVDVLMRVEEGVEGGGGGCLCESCSTATNERIALTTNVIDIAGVPGTGKTATVHAVIKQLRARAEEGVSDIWLRYPATTVSLIIAPTLRTYYLSPTSRLTVSKSRRLNMPIQYYGRRFPVKRSPTRRPPCEG